MFASKKLVAFLFLSFFFSFLKVFTRVDILVDIYTMVFVYWEVSHITRIAVNLKFLSVKRVTKTFFISMTSGFPFEVSNSLIFVKVGCYVFFISLLKIQSSSSASFSNHFQNIFLMSVKNWGKFGSLNLLEALFTFCLKIFLYIFMITF